MHVIFCYWQVEKFNQPKTSNIIACCIGDIEYTVVMAWTSIFIACCIGDIEYTVVMAWTSIFTACCIGDIEYTVVMAWTSIFIACCLVILSTLWSWPGHQFL